MKIERVFVDLPELQRLEKQVAETAEIVRDWKNSIAKIETELNTANLSLMRAKKDRESHALKAAMGDAAAIAAVKHARSEQHAAEQTTADLAIALPEAEAHLANAERSAESARHQLAKLHGEKLMRQRVDAATRMDKAFSEAASAYGDYERLGRELQSFPDLNLAVSGNMSFYEGATGFRRIAASLPLFFLKLFPGSTWNEGQRTPLAQSEAHFWQLPPVETGKSKAA